MWTGSSLSRRRRQQCQVFVNGSTGEHGASVPEFVAMELKNVSEDVSVALLERPTAVLVRKFEAFSKK